MADATPTDRPTRVIEGTVNLVRCPVCRQTIMASVTGEVRLGELSIAAADLGQDQAMLTVTAPTRTRIRSLTVEHTCDPKDVALVEQRADEAAEEPAPVDPPKGRPIADSPQA